MPLEWLQGRLQLQDVTQLAMIGLAQPLPRSEATTAQSAWAARAALAADAAAEATTVARQEGSGPHGALQSYPPPRPPQSARRARLALGGMSGDRALQVFS
mmetsp:Transcript_60188/g.167946  ORF Transcript_60188/g.167946 Transcript_60188/m.167946 type:complete len:101 (+) Transcript_60188:1166-1468(+)